MYYYINVLYFFSLLGFVLESTVYKISRSKRYSGIFYGPITMVYGFGVLALILIKKYFIDTVLINKILFIELGIKEENIIDCEICSVCNKDKIRSYRAEGKDFKLATAVIGL